MSANQHKTTYLKDYTPPKFRIPQVALSFVLGESGTLVNSKLLVERSEDTPAHEPIVLQGQELELLDVAIDGVALKFSDYQVDETHLTVPCDKETFTLEISVKIFPEKNTSLMGLYQSKHGFFTQCEAEGFRKITYFQDRPDVLSRFTTRIQAKRDRFPVLLSNGNLIESGALDKNEHYAIWEDPHLKPCYLFALVAGNLKNIRDTFTTKSGRPVKLEIYAPEKQIGYTSFAMDALKRSMRWDEERFGLEVDLDQYMVVAVDDFNMGAMENKGLNIFNTKYVLADAKTSTDRDFMLLDRVVAHEYFHNWTGNRVTCRDWFQLSLKEGLTVFRDQEYGADTYSRAVQRIQEVKNLRAIQFPEDAGPIAHAVRPDSYVEINNFYTATIYEKGAELVRMIHTIIGEESFQKGMKIYFERHDGCAVTTEEFVAAMESASKKDLSQFRRWYTQPGTPNIHVSSHFDKQKKSFCLTFEQNFGAKRFADNQPLYIPISIALFDQSGRALPMKTKETLEETNNEALFVLTEQKQYITFEGIDEPPVPSLLRGFSAPVNLSYDYTDEELATLFLADNDPFNRWEAGQRLQTRIILRNVEALRTGTNISIPDQLTTSFAALLRDHQSDPAFIAEALSTPTEAYLAEQLEEVDPEHLYQARAALRQETARALEKELLAICNKTEIAESYSPAHHQAGQRALKNTCLAYLMELETDTYADRCYSQMLEATNMTDQFTAYQLLVSRDNPKRAEAIHFFYETWKEEPLVVDKWLSAQATASHADTPNIVKALKKHEAFDIRNPNKVYSLIRAFGANHRHFHSASGDGYRLIADTIIELDALNPQVAARVARSFDRWKKFDQDHQRIARAELERIKETPKLSSDTFEVVSKALTAA